jgi:MSHA pilin protein MshC
MSVLPRRAAPPLPSAGKGFTLIELVIVIVLMGVLAVLAAPRILDRSTFDARGFHDQTLAYLRFAQKTAVAQRRTVCVSFSGGNSLSLKIASQPAVYSCDTDLPGPTGESPGRITGNSGVTYSGNPSSFNFDALGQPVDSAGAALATQTLQVATAANTITVEAGTGYVHE